MLAPLSGHLQRGVACCPSLRWHYPDQVLSVGGEQIGHPLSLACPSSRYPAKKFVNYMIFCEGYSIQRLAVSRKQKSEFLLPGGKVCTIWLIDLCGNTLGDGAYLRQRV